MPASINRNSASTVAAAWASTSWCTPLAAPVSAGCDAPRGSIIPIDSASVLIVLAVNIAPQVPLPGITDASSSAICSAVIRPASRAARPSIRSRMVRLFPFDAHGSNDTRPGEFVPA